MGSPSPFSPSSPHPPPLSPPLPHFTSPSPHPLSPLPTPSFPLPSSPGGLPWGWPPSLCRLNRVRRPVGGYGEMVVAVRAAVTRCSSSRTFCGAGSSHDQAKSTLLQGQVRSEGARSAEGAHEEGFDAAWCSCFDAERAAEASGPCGQSDAA